MILCDGHGSHLMLALIKFCLANHMHIILHVPHPSHLTQGEDLTNFKLFKVAYRKRKHARFAKLFAEHKPHLLKASDVMPIVTPAWEAAFAPEYHLCGWKEAGIVLFTRSVMHTIIRIELHKAKRQSADPRTANKASTTPCWRACLARHLQAVASKAAASMKARRTRANKMATAPTCAAACLRHRSTPMARSRRAADLRCSRKCTRPGRLTYRPGEGAAARRACATRSRHDG